MNEILEDIRSIKLTSKNIRIFILIAAVLGSLACHKFIPKLSRVEIYVLIWGISGISLVFWKIWKPIYQACMIVGICIGWMVSKIVFTTFFFVIITPIAFITRTHHRHRLSLPWKTDKKTYWQKKEKKNNRVRELVNQY